MLPGLVFLEHIDVSFASFVSIHPHEQTTFDSGCAGLASNHLLCLLLSCSVNRQTGRKWLSSSGEGGGAVFILRASEGGTEGARAALPSMLPSSRITSPLPFSASRSLAIFPVVIFPPFIHSPPPPPGFCSITLCVPLPHLDYLFHIIASRPTTDPELSSPCCVRLSAWGALITPS